ncbi:MAG: response regulator, partial [Saprospiraceae bacterium]
AVTLSHRLTQFTVTDTGIGIPAEKISAIFDSFQQAGEDTTARFGGTGLGLTIARELVQLHGSDIKVESEVGKGSSFSFDLYLPLANAADLDKESGVAASLFFSTTLRILLADDNALNREIATEAIRRHFENAEIVEAVNGKEAVEMLEAARNPDLPGFKNLEGLARGLPDLVLMDMQMPEMTGTEATRHIRKHISTDIPIIALTASATSEEIENALESGMNRHLGKPFKPQELAQVVAEVLGFSTSEGLKTLPTLDELDFLRDFCNGDEGQMRHFIQKFLDQYPLEIERLELALEAKDRKALYQAAHSFRPQLEFVGLKKAAALALQLEQNALMETDSGVFTSLLEQLKNESNGLQHLESWPS